jgi:ribonucleoside-diphosphate reductase alpha chain
VEGAGSIMARAREAATTMRMGGGIGYCFSTLRPRGDSIRKLDSRSSGPISFMEIFNSIGLCIASAGHRRGAQMGTMRIDHPDIEEFVRAKQNNDRLTGFNVSVGVTDEFMACLSESRPFPLKFEGRVYREVDPHDLWEMIMRSTWDWAEPGVLFIDRINQMNNLRYCETIATTNPCGEQPLPPYGACLLGSFNLVKYVRGVNPITRDLPRFDVEQFKRDIPVVVRAMDNVVDRAIYPLREQEQEAQSKRRMGLGVTGLANALEALGHPYGSDTFLEMEESILRTLRDEAYRASVELAKEKGPFPLFDNRYLDSEFVSQLPSDVRDGIAEHGIRNSHLTSIAPTGTISLCADNVSSGIEPVFAYESLRTIIGPDGSEEHVVQDYGMRVFGVPGKRSQEVTAQEHLAVLAVAYRYVDSAVSKTCNVPADMPWDDFKQLYVDAYDMGCKGCTTFQVGGMRGAMMVEKSCRIDTETGRRECD